MATPPAFVRAAHVEGEWVQLRGLWVRVRATGPRDAPAILLLHHFHGNVDTWRHVHALLADYRVVSFDRPGFGYTQRPLVGRAGNGVHVPGRPDRLEDPYSRGAAAELANDLLEALAVRSAVVVGASAGGSVALEIFARFRDRVAGLVLVNPAITGDAGPPGSLRPFLRATPVRYFGAVLAAMAASRVGPTRVGRSWHDVGRVNREDVEVYRRPMRERRWGQATWMAMVGEQPPDLRWVLPTIDVPTLVVGGASDPLVPPRWNLRTSQAIDGAKLVVLDGVGHTPHEEQPQALVAAMKPLLDVASR